MRIDASSEVLFSLTAQPPAKAENRLRGALSESAGALGDLGTFLPLTIGAVRLAGFDASAVLVTAGVAHIVTGIVFRIPVAVQPMKAIAALAIAGVLTQQQVLGAGLFVGLVTLLCGVSGLAHRAARLVPAGVVSALQAGLAVQLLLSGVWLAGRTASGGTTVWNASALLLAAALFGVAALLRRRLDWIALGLAAAGIIVAAIGDPALLHLPSLTVWTPRWSLSGAEVWSGIWSGGVAQLPLTMLNSVLAASALAVAYFPEQRLRNTPARLAVSIGLMNLLACPWGGLPVCHGSGGLAGQYRMGARSGASMVLLGAVKCALGLFCGAAAIAWINAFPAVILGVFLMLAGVALAEASRFWRAGRTLVAATAVVLVQTLTSSLPLGFLAGWAADALWPVMAAMRREGVLG